MLLTVTGTDIDTIAIGICKGQYRKVRIRFGNLFQPFIASTAGFQRIQVSSGMNKNRLFHLGLFVSHGWFGGSGLEVVGLRIESNASNRSSGWSRPRSKVLIHLVDG